MTIGSTIKLTNAKGARYFVTLTYMSQTHLHGHYAYCGRRSWSFKPSECFGEGAFPLDEVSKIEVCPTFSHNIAELAQNK